MICIKCKQKIPQESIYCMFCGKKQVKTEKTVKDKKNPNGYGSIIKLDGRRRKPWAVRVTESYVDKKQKFRYVGYYETRTEAKAALAKEQICPTSPKANISLAELYEEWTDTVAFKDISKQTQDNYSAAYKHLSPLHNIKFTDLRAKHYQNVIDDLERSTSTKNKIKVLCGLLYKYAMQNDIINKNYADFIKIKSEAPKEKNVFTEKEIQILHKNVQKIQHTDTILILIYTGLRINEMLNLKRSSINLQERTIKGGLKTDAGRDRIVPISNKIYALVEKLYNACENDDDYLFVREPGKHITYNYYIKNIFYNILETLKIIEPNSKRLTPHSARHTCATLLAASGADINSIKSILGHTDYAFTADVYTHVDINTLSKAINMI